jgi:hypothetical protein
LDSEKTAKDRNILDSVLSRGRLEPVLARDGVGPWVVYLLVTAGLTWAGLAMLRVGYDSPESIAVLVGLGLGLAQDWPAQIHPAHPGPRRPNAPGPPHPGQVGGLASGRHLLFPPAIAAVLGVVLEVKTGLSEFLVAIAVTSAVAIALVTRRLGHRLIGYLGWSIGLRVSLALLSTGLALLGLSATTAGLVLAGLVLGVGAGLTGAWWTAWPPRVGRWSRLGMGAIVAIGLVGVGMAQTVVGAPSAMAFLGAIVAFTGALARERQQAGDSRPALLPGDELARNRPC